MKLSSLCSRTWPTSVRPNSRSTTSGRRGSSGGVAAPSMPSGRCPPSSGSPTPGASPAKRPAAPPPWAASAAGVSSSAPSYDAAGKGRHAPERRPAAASGVTTSSEVVRPRRASIRVFLARSACDEPHPRRRRELPPDLLRTRCAGRLHGLHGDASLLRGVRGRTRLGRRGLPVHGLACFHRPRLAGLERRGAVRGVMKRLAGVAARVGSCRRRAGEPLDFQRLGRRFADGLVAHRVKSTRNRCCPMRTKSRSRRLTSSRMAT